MRNVDPPRARVRFTSRDTAQPDHDAAALRSHVETGIHQNQSPRTSGYSTGNRWPPANRMWRLSTVGSALSNDARFTYAARRPVCRAMCVVLLRRGEWTPAPHSREIPHEARQTSPHGLGSHVRTIGRRLREHRRRQHRIGVPARQVPEWRVGRDLQRRWHVRRHDDHRRRLGERHLRGDRERGRHAGHLGEREAASTDGQGLHRRRGSLRLDAGGRRADGDGD